MPDETGVCRICLDKYDNRCALLTCFHSFCLACAMSWFDTATKCPLCRTNVISVIDSHGEEHVVKPIIPPEEPEEVEEPNYAQQSSDFIDLSDLSDFVVPDDVIEYASPSPPRHATPTQPPPVRRTRQIHVNYRDKRKVRRAPY